MPVRPPPRPPPAAARSSAGIKERRQHESLLTSSRPAGVTWADPVHPRQGLGNSAIAAVADDEQMERFGRVWASMAITEPDFGSDSAASPPPPASTATVCAQRHQDLRHLRRRADHIVVWATLDKSKGRAAISRSSCRASIPASRWAEHKLGIRASDTAQISFTDCRIPKENLWAIRRSGWTRLRRRHADVRQHPPARGRHGGGRGPPLSRRSHPPREAGLEIDYDRPATSQPAAVANTSNSGRLGDHVPPDAQAMDGDNKMPNTKEASMCKAKAGRVGSTITLGAVELAGTLGYSSAASWRSGRVTQDSRHLEVPSRSNSW